MLCDRIKELRETNGYSQSQLAKKLGVTRSSVNAWEMGLSTPTTQYVIALSKLFRVTSDYLLELETHYSLSLDGYSEEEISVILNLLNLLSKKH